MTSERFISPSSATKQANEVFRAQGAVAADALLSEALQHWPAHPALLTKRLQINLQGKLVEAAADLADEWRSWRVPDARLLAMAALAMQRAGRINQILELFESHQSELISEEAAVIPVMDAFMAARDYKRVLEIGALHIKAVGEVRGTINDRLGRAHNKLGDIDASNEQLLLAIEKGHAVPQVLALLSRNLLAQGTPKLAIPFLEQTLHASPALSKVRIDLARARKLSGDFKGAVAELDTIPDEIFDANPPFRRLKVACLTKVGRFDDAREEFAKLQKQQADRTVGRLKSQLDTLWDRPLTLPEARLEWAAKISGEPEGVHKEPEWRRRALWGYEADRLLLDWIESREDLIEEVMYLFDDIDEVEAEAKRIIGDGASVIVSAHIGAIFSGPVMLELLNTPTKWLASTPNLEGLHYNDQLISVANRTEAEVGRTVLSTLRGGGRLTIALDGATNPAAPKVLFEGQQVTWSGFVAAMIYRLKIPSMFAVPVWRNGRIRAFIREMDMPRPGQTSQDYVQTYREQFFGYVKDVLRTGPENLRLSGGIWRYVN